MEVAPSAREAVAVPIQGRDKPGSIFEGVKVSAGSAGGGTPQMPVACVSGVLREIAHAGVVQRVAPAGGGSSGPRSISNEINQQVLHSKYKFRENAPLREYLRQRVPTFREVLTLRKVLTMLKDIIRDNLLFDENNPAMIVGDPPLEAALGRKEVDVRDIRSVVHRQLMLVEACPGPLAANFLAGGMAMLTGVVSNPRTEARAATAPASAPTGRVIDFQEIPSGSVVTLREVRAPGSAPGDGTRVIGTVTYVPPPRGSEGVARPQPGTGQGSGGAPATSAPTAPSGSGVRVHMTNRSPGAAGVSRLSREAAASISQIIVTLTLLLANAGQSDGFLAYDCNNVRSVVKSYPLTPREGCWMKHPQHPTPEPRDGRILWMRDGARFPVIRCKMTETTMRADCDAVGRVRPWRVVASEKQIPIGPMSCMEISVSRKVTLFNRTITLTTKGTAMDILEERINYGPKGNCPSTERRSEFGEAYAKLTVRRIIVWERKATESLIKKTITMGANDVLPNFVRGGMDAAKGTYIWNYTVRSCQEEELEELYNGRLGVFKSGSVVLGGADGGQRAWLRIEKGVTICGRRMRQTHLRMCM
jgi:hypothetical protein